MESHPVPQNVTSFEFHLVGDMTLKQFGYLAAGLTTAYLTFLFLFPISKLISIPVIIISASLGTAFAFLPIADRPLDHWTLAFFKAVYSPTKRHWQNPFGRHLADSDPFFTNRLKLYLAAVNPPIQTSAIRRQLSDVNSTPSDPSSPSSPPLKGLTRILATSSLDVRPAIVPAVPPQPVPIAPILIPQVMAFTPLPTPTIALSSGAPLPVKSTPTFIPAPKPIPIAPTFQPTSVSNNPNIISGLVLNSQNAPIEGAIIIINNQQNMPVRALKTQKAGSFTGATPLPNGKYLLEVEKDGHSFPPTQVELIGNPLPSLIIRSQAAVA